MADGVETQHEDRSFALPEAPMGLQVLLPPRGAVVGFTVEAAGSADKQVMSALACWDLHRRRAQPLVCSPHNRPMRWRFYYYFTEEKTIELNNVLKVT